MKTICFIGAGNVASHLACALKELGYTIGQVYSRTEQTAQILAEKLGCTYTTEIKEIGVDYDFYFFCVKDSVLSEIIDHFPHSNGIWIHTAGSMPLDIFRAKKVNQFGVLYPLQTFSKEKEISWDHIPLFIEASSKETLDEIELIAEKLSDKVYPLSTEKRKYVHASGVFACNFVNYMYELGNQMIAKADLSFQVLLPLIDETCKKVHSLQPRDAQTGPAIRYDMNVMEKQLQLIENPKTKEIYKLLSSGIHDLYKD